MKSLSRVQLFATPWTITCQASPFMEFSRKEYWSGVPFLSPEDLPNSGIKTGSPALQADALPSEPPGKPYQLTNGIFTELEQKISQFIWKYKRSQIVRTSLRKKNRARGINLPNFRLYNKATVIKTVCYCHKTRNIDQWNAIESPDINPCTHGHLDVDREGKNIQWRKDGLFNTCFWGNCTATPKLMNL